MRIPVMLAALALGLVLAGAPAVYAAAPWAAFPASPAGQWQGTAAEFQSPYLSTGTARVTLDLKPDGTFTETWKQRDREWSMSGKWHAQGDKITPVADDRGPTRMTVRPKGETLYAVAPAPLPAQGRVAPETM